jgi:hypothetical protein
METKGPTGTTCLKVWNVSYGPTCVEVAAETHEDAQRVACMHLGLKFARLSEIWSMRVNKVDRTIIVEVREVR